MEHLLRDIKDASLGHFTKEIGDKIMALKALKEKLREMKAYLENVISGKYKYNHAIIHNYQVSFYFKLIGYFQFTSELEGRGNGKECISENE